MNDFERKLRSQPFREPPAAWRREILACCESAAPKASWREWLWPSPYAWAALAAVWVALGAVVAIAPRPAGDAGSPKAVTHDAETRAALLARREMMSHLASFN